MRLSKLYTRGWLLIKKMTGIVHFNMNGRTWANYLCGQADDFFKLISNIKMKITARDFHFDNVLLCLISKNINYTYQMPIAHFTNDDINFKSFSQL